MKSKKRITRNVLKLTMAFLLFVAMRNEVLGVTMADYTAVPPFLSSGGVDPNLILFIDNSASMYDLAYVDDQGYCYDDTYASSTSHVGYFVPDSWYAYNFASLKFESKTDAEATTICSSATYSNNDVCVTLDATPSVTAFAAKGNFLNWAAASKLDIEKEILTGGKYDSTNGLLVMESRGCLGRRFVKKVAVTDSGSNTYYLTLAVRPPESSEKANSLDDTTRIEIYQFTSSGFVHTDCQDAIEELSAEIPNQGQIGQEIENCMYYSSSDRGLADSMSAFNHSLHNCWYLSKEGIWPPGAGPTESVKNDCARVYEDLYAEGKMPSDISTDDRGYVCYGDHATSAGYVGRCWDPTVATYRSNGAVELDGWVSDECIEQALQDYCGQLEIPQVIDPSDQADQTSEFWNMPAVLIDSGVVAQLAEPLAVLKGYIAQSTAPTGLIQQYAGDMRMGAMSFNDNGSASECAGNDDMDCPSGTNYDGGKVVASIDQGSAHTLTLVSAVNDIKATSWTPMAEAFYNAIGYYTQNTSLRLNATDFSTGTDPVTEWCQFNNILIVTDGASTADLNSSVSSFTATDGQNDADNDDISECGSLSGSTGLDDLTYYAKHGTAIYPTGQGQVNGEDKQTITTYIVVSGDLRSTGADECSPDVLLTNAATNGGTSLYQATDPSNLEDQLTQAFVAISAKASSGTAASVVSAASRGEGAIYQAVFYQSFEDANGAEINWIGKLHALFIDHFGNMREDTNGNHALDLAADKIVEVFFDDSEGRTRATRDVDANADGVADGSPATIELYDVEYVWEAGQSLAERTSARDIYTWIDKDRDGAVDGGSTPDNDEYVAFSTGNAADLRPYLAMETSGTSETTKLINYIHGADQVGYRARTIDVEGTDRVWKLGDIIYSTPTVVGRPEENYDLIYSDTSYRTFKTYYKDRRHVVYVGANDGMLHAFNGGFFDSTDSEFEVGTSTPSYSSAVPVLGEELWAYIPMNLLPHLRWLADQNYSHVYYVDLKPKIIDAKVFTADAVHPGGWGTVLVCGMRMGGGPMSLSETDVNYDWDGDGTIEAGETKTFRSAYFALDITNTEEPPTLLWEYTDADLGFTTSFPTVVHVDFTNTIWTIAFGSGPTDYEGTSTQAAKTYVLNLKTGAPISGSPLTTGTVSAGIGSFMGDPMSVDMNIAETQCSGGSCSYGPDVFYIGNSQGVMRRITGMNLLSAGTPSDFLDLGSTKPIVGAPSASQDGDGRLWIYFGTGRFFSDIDKDNTDTQSLVGVKEPFDWADCDGDSETEEPTIYCGSPTVVSSSNLLDVSDYTVFEQGYIDTDSDFSNYETTFDNLVGEIKQTASDTDDPKHYDGWILNMTGGERCTTKPTILGGITTFSSFTPGASSDACAFGGQAYLYALYYKTGTAYMRSILGYGDGTMTLDVGGETETHKEILRGVAMGKGVSATPSLHVGQAQGVKAFIQSSTGEIFQVDQLPPEGYKSRPLHWIQVSD